MTRSQPCLADLVSDSAIQMQIGSPCKQTFDASLQHLQCRLRHLGSPALVLTVKDSHANNGPGLSQELPGADWKKGLEAGSRVRARIIYVDAAAKRVCLSLLPHLVAAKIDSLSLPPANTLFEVGSCCRHPLLACTLLLCIRSSCASKY